MNTSSNNAKAFEIFAKYEGSRKLTGSSSEVYAGPNPNIVSDEDKKELNRLGWKPKSVDATFIYAGE